MKRYVFFGVVFLVSFIVLSILFWNSISNSKIKCTSKTSRILCDSNQLSKYFEVFFKDSASYYVLDNNMAKSYLFKNMKAMEFVIYEEDIEKPKFIFGDLGGYSYQAYVKNDNVLVVIKLQPKFVQSIKNKNDIESKLWLNSVLTSSLFSLKDPTMVDIPTFVPKLSEKLDIYQKLNKGKFILSFK